jgi:hypothetical protein
MVPNAVGTPTMMGGAVGALGVPAQLATPIVASTTISETISVRFILYLLVKMME